MGGMGSGRPKNPPKVKAMLKDILPVNEILAEDEVELYHSLVDIYLGDFDADDLTASDFDDIMGLAMNKIIEHRLFKTAKDNPGQQLNIATAIEKLRKQNKDYKESLSARRKDRVNPNELKGFSIVDIAVAFDNEKKQALEEKVRSMNKNMDEIKNKRCGYVGNKNDFDAKDLEVD